jgi:putative peptidoglycan lipid II flippase
MRQIRLISGFFTVGIWTLASRFLGFIRDAMIVAFLGTGPLYEAYIVAFRLPNLFRRFFAEGAANMAFIPLFSKKLENGEDPAGFARDAMSALVGILIVLTLLAQIFMPWLIYAIASGYEGEKFDLSVEFGRIAFPYIFFISMAALLSGVLNATGRFAAAAAAPVLLNILFILAMLIAVQTGGSVARWLVWAIPVAGVAQFALVWIAAARAGFRILPRWPRLTPDVKRLAIIAAPAALAGGVVQVNLVVGQQVASYFPRAVGWLFTADRLYQLPLGVVGIAIGVVLLPDLSRRLKADDQTGSRHALSRAGEMALILTVPSAVALCVIAHPLVSVLFERRAFTADDSAATALAVSIYGLGLPAFVLQKVLQPLYFAREDTKTPFRYALISLVVNAMLAIGLAPFIGWIAAAIATSLAGWAMVWLLWRGSFGMGEVAQFDDRFRSRLWRIVSAALIMGAGIYGMSALLETALATATIRYGALALLVFAGMGIYAAAGQMIGAFSLSEIRTSLSRRRAS